MMQYELHYLPFAGLDEDGNPEPEREMGHRIAIDDHTPTPEEVDDLWVKQTEGELEDVDDDDEALRRVWAAYNRGSGSAHLHEMDEKEMRSLSVNDIVILDGTAYRCARVGWEEIEVNIDD